MLLPKTSRFINYCTYRLISKTSQQPRPDGKQYRLWKIPGDFVYYKDVLAKQYTMFWHPGLNVGIDFDRALYALCDGVMVVTEEEFKIDWDFHLTKQIYKDVDGNELQIPKYQRYLHVIPKKRISEFRLIDEV